MIEVDIEYGGRRAAGPNLFDHRLQTFAEENTIRQATERVVHGEMAQPRFAGRYRRGGATHVAQHESSEQRKADEGDCDKRHHVVHDLSAWLLRRPGETRDDVIIWAAEVVGEVAAQH